MIKKSKKFEGSFGDFNNLSKNMQLSILYNWPMGEDSARVSLGMANIDDIKYQYKLTILDKNDKGEDRWFTLGYVNHDEVHKLDTFAKRTSIVRVHKMSKDGDYSGNDYKFYLSKDWPLEASGASVTHVSYLI